MSHVLRILIREIIADNPTPKIAGKRAPAMGADEYKEKQAGEAAARIIRTFGWDVEKKLGRGAYGVVYLARNDAGQQIAIKLTMKDESAEYKKVQAVREKLPDELKKHVPVIHFVHDLGDDRPGGFVNAIGIEVLKPLPSQVADRLLKPAGTSPLAMQDVLKDEEIIIKILRTAAEKMGTSAVAKEVNRHTNIGRLLSNVESKTLQGKMPEGYANDQIRKEIQLRAKDWSDREFSLKARKLALLAGSWMERLASEAKVSPTQAKLLGTNMAIMVVRQLQSTAMGIANPDDPDASNWEPGIFSTLPGAENIPGAASLGKALRAMAKFGLSWQDLHQDNVMMRPSTGDIVVSDFGNFNII